MKKVILVSLLAVLALGGYAKKDKAPNPICGVWKYSNGSTINDFQRITKQEIKKQNGLEYFVFYENNKFKHEFLDNNKQIYKVLEGKWKASDGKIKINYSGIDFQLSLDYFFIDKDLVLGQNFNHVILSKDAYEISNDNVNLASLMK